MKLAAAIAITLEKANVKDPEQLLFDGNKRRPGRTPDFQVCIGVQIDKDCWFFP